MRCHARHTHSTRLITVVTAMPVTLIYQHTARFVSATMFMLPHVYMTMCPCTIYLHRCCWGRRALPPRPTLLAGQTEDECRAAWGRLQPEAAALLRQLQPEAASGSLPGLCISTTQMAMAAAGAQQSLCNGWYALIANTPAV